VSALPLGVLPGRRSGPGRGCGTLTRWRAAELDLLEGLRIRGWERWLFVECGDGWVAEEVWRRMGKGYVCGLDTSSRVVALATELRAVPGKLEFKTWDGRCVPYSDESFDSVVSQCDVRGWLEPVSFLREIRRVVRAGGAVYLVEVEQGAGGGRVSASPDWPRLVEQAGLLLNDASIPSVGEGGVAGDDRRPARMLCARPAGRG
jgi:ubiquinone/menaquinone biosynthesis C-methylase UbiE